MRVSNPQYRHLTKVVHHDILHMPPSCSSLDITVVGFPKPGVTLKYLKRDYLGCGMRPIWGLFSRSHTHFILSW